MTSPGPEAHLRFDVWRSGIGQPVKVQITDTRTGRVVTATEPTEMQARARCAEQMTAPTLSEWLLEQLAEDERVAREAGGGGKRPGAGSWNRECGHRGFDDELLPPGHGSCCVVDGDIRIYDEGGHDPEQADHIARHDPARALAEVAAKRQLVELHCPSRNYIDEMGSHALADGEILVCASCGDQGRDENEVVAPCPTLRLLALPYAGQPGYREQWRP